MNTRQRDGERKMSVMGVAKKVIFDECPLEEFAWSTALTAAVQVSGISHPGCEVVDILHPAGP